MSEKEKREFYIAMCRCCLIAQAMKSCPACRFNIGLAEQIAVVEPILLPIYSQTALFAMAE